MKRVRLFFVRSFDKVFLTIGLIAIGLVSHELMAEDFQINLKDGSVITIQTPEQNITWTDVLPDGEMVKRDISLSNVKELVLSSSPASAQVAAIREYLTDLSSGKYADRQNAEDQLSDPGVGGAFRSLIESQADHEEFEVRYRIGRIISRLEGETEDSASEFDVMITKDGERIEGDAGDFSLAGKFRDRNVTFERSQISLIATPQKSPNVTKSGKQVEVAMFHDHNGTFYLPGQMSVEMESSPSGHDLPDKGDITGTYIPVGLKLGTEQEGFVGISGYGFKFDLLPVGGKSVCVFENMGNYHKRFRGVMVLDFCMPNQESVPAGVREIGLFIARVGHSRDIILEAYNADGHLLACVESTDKPCVFVGVKSNELITKVRILSNPHLFRVDRSIDNDYAVDSICFTPPEPVTNPKNATSKSVRLKNGDMFVSRSMKITNVISTYVNDEPFDIPMDEVDAIQFGRKEVPLKTPSWAVLLKDGSLLHVKTGKQFKSTRFSGLEFGMDDIAAITTSKNPIRFPAVGDFDKGKNVIVFPTCRIADEVKFSQTGFSWNKTATKIQQPLFTGKEDPKDEDPTPKINSIEYAKAWPENIPTVWLSRPMILPPNSGKIRLVDGQQLSIGANSTFQLKKLSQDKIVLSAGGKDTTIMLKDVMSVDLPDE